MKKFFTLIAAAFMTMGMNAQTLDFAEKYTEEQAAGTVNDITLGDDNFKAQFTGGAKAKIAAKSLTFKVDAESAAENFTMQWAPGGGITKLTGERSVTITVAKKGTLTIYARSAGSDDRAFTVEQNGSTILNAVAYNGTQFEEKYYKAYAVEVAAGTANIKATDAINISGLKFEASADEGGDEGDDPTETTTIASWDQEATVGTGYTWSAVGTAVISGYTGKIHSNKDVVKCMTFPNSAWAKATTDATENSFLHYVKVEGEFKKGDIVTIIPFTAMSTADFTGGSKYGSIALYDAEGTVIQDMTGSTAAALTVTDGHEEAEDPESFSYTLTNDYTALCFGRVGNTRINIISIAVERPAETTAVAEVKAEAQAAPAVKKVFKNGQLIIINGASEFNVAGQQVK